MKTIFTLNNSILATHYTNYMRSKNINNKLISQTLTDLEISQLYDKKYNLTEFEIYKFITAHDYINESLGCNKFTLTEGITSDKNKYNNILIDLFYMNLSPKLISNFPISIVFKIKQKGLDIYDLTKKIY